MSGAAATVGVDGGVLGLAAATALRSALERAGIALRSDIDAFDRAWEERPAAPAAPVWEHLPPQAATSRADKLASVRAAMRTAGATHHLVSTVDDIAWLTNLRGSDVDYNPVFLAHALIDAQAASLFVGDGKVADANCANGWPPTAFACCRTRPPRRPSPPCLRARRCWSTRSASLSACASAFPMAWRWSRRPIRARC